MITFRMRMVFWLVVLGVLVALPGYHWWLFPAGAVSYLLLFWKYLPKR